MAARTTAAFLAGVAVGWVGRSLLGSTREAMVKGLVVTHEIRERLHRAVAERAEWLEDMFAEGRARYEAGRSHGDGSEHAPHENGTSGATNRRHEARGHAA
jgi:hypothetical protein